MTKQILKELEEKHLNEINNPKINENDHLYNKNMILLVSQKSNWHLYFNPNDNIIYSIAVVPSARSTIFGDISYLKRWYNYHQYNSKNTMLCLTDKAIELLKLNGKGIL